MAAASAGQTRIEDPDRLAARLAQYPSTSKRAMRQSNARVARQGRSWARMAAASGSPLQAKMAGGIGASSTSAAATLTVRNTGRAPAATVAFFGAKRRTGWYGARRYAGSPAQHPPWVGNRWKVATRGQGPYVINDMLVERLDEIKKLFLAGQLAALAGASPLPTGSGT